MRAHMNDDVGHRQAWRACSQLRVDGEEARRMQSVMGCSWFRLGVNSRILVFVAGQRVGRWNAERRRSARDIWL